MLLEFKDYKLVLLGETLDVMYKEYVEGALNRTIYLENDEPQKLEKWFNDIQEGIENSIYNEKDYEKEGWAIWWNYIRPHEDKLIRFIEE